MVKIIECVPNISEGRNYRTIEILANCIRSVPQVQLMDIHRDRDHNRSVFSFLGTPEGVLQAVYDLTEEAIELIDISQHDGVHPYMGAVDVIPFIPVQGVTAQECIELAETAGKKIETMLHVPVYYYEQASTDPKTRNLADLRAQSYNLKKHRTAGAIAVGVRGYLVAYNINLNTNKVEAAKEIAAALREKNGGLPGVKALGFKLESRALVQVSINLVQPFKTTPEMVTAKVKELAQKKGIAIAETELVGLRPHTVKAAAKNFEKYYGY